MKKKKLNPIYILLLGLLVVYFPAFLVFYKEVFPKTRTHFLSYRSFVAKTDWTIYRKELPKSARDLRYYFYEGLLADKNGFHASFSDEDYKLMKEERMAAYHPEFTNTYSYDGQNKFFLNREKMREWKVDYIDQLIPKEKDNGQYYYLVYYMSDDSKIYSYECVLCNDVTKEIVEISCRICH